MHYYCVGYGIIIKKKVDVDNLVIPKILFLNFKQ